MLNRLAERVRRRSGGVDITKRKKHIPPSALQIILPSATATRMDYWSEETRLQPRTSPITDDYEISNHVLGLGINGKVVQCYDRKTRHKYALKV